jgi:AbrB family looped-hinge helix DNA binding protein
VSRTVVRGRGQITIPQGVRKAVHLEEGDPVWVEVVSEGILIRTEKAVPSSQAWFWTSTWQQREREAEEDKTRGRFERFDSDEAFLASLADGMKPPDADP